MYPEKEDSQLQAPNTFFTKEKRFHERRIKKKGFFIVIDGLDGAGKGEIMRALDAYEQRLGKAVFDSVAFSKANRKGLPELQDFWNPPETYYDTIITSEPTYAGIGHNIRKEIISKNQRVYSSETEIQAYSMDRLIQMLRVVIPALENGLNVIQSRCFASTLTYQSLRAAEEGKNPEEIRKRILEHEGNKLQLEWAPDLLIIPSIQNVNELVNRLKNSPGREKEDNAIFENLKFQEKLKPLYESPWLKEIFEQQGTKVERLDAGISIEESRRQSIEIYKRFLKEKQTNF